MSNNTNFELVVLWMLSVGQDAPEAVTMPNYDVLSLRKELIREESQECLSEFTEAMLRFSVPGAPPASPSDLAPLAKELVDLLVVTYGALVALGIDGDTIFRAVMCNNFDKVQFGSFRDDGKLIVDMETKARLKREITKKLEELLNATN